MASPFRHQDPVVIKRFPAFNVDVYLDDSDEENACVGYSGSHLGGYHVQLGETPSATSLAGPMTARAKTSLEPSQCAPTGAMFLCTQRPSYLQLVEPLRSNARTLYYHFDSWEDVNLGGGHSARTRGLAVTQTVRPSHHNVPTAFQFQSDPRCVGCMRSDSMGHGDHSTCGDAACCSTVPVSHILRHRLIV